MCIGKSSGRLFSKLVIFGKQGWMGSRAREISTYTYFIVTFI